MTSATRTRACLLADEVEANRLADTARAEQRRVVMAEPARFEVLKPEDFISYRVAGILEWILIVCLVAWAVFDILLEAREQAAFIGLGIHL